MIIIKQNNITIPRGISPSFVTTDHDISLQKKSVTITKNGVATISPDSGYDALSSVRVTTDVQATPKLQNIVKTYVENGNYSLTPGTSYDGIGNVSITINIPEKVINLQDKNENIVSNGDYRYTPDASYDGLSSVNVHVEVPEKKIILQNKDITENGSVTYDEGFDGLGTVNVNVPIPEYRSEIKDVSYDKNGSFTLKPDASYDGISQANITVNLPEKVYKTQEKTAVPTTSEQRIIPDSSFDALSDVVISAVDSTIDSNIIPTNIKKGVSILGVEGTNEPHVFPMGTVLAQDILSDEPAPQNLVYNAAERDIDGYSNVEIERIAQESITKTITANGTVTINPSTDYDVIKDVNITVNVPPKDPTLQEKTIDASSLINETKDIVTETITHDQDFDGLSKVTYTRLNLAKNRTTAVGVLPDKSGSYVFFKPEKGFDGFLNFGFRINYQEPTVDPSTSQQLIEPSTGYACFKSVTVNPVTSAIDSNIIPANIKKGVSILGVEGTYENTNNQQKEIKLRDYNFTTQSLGSTDTFSIEPDQGYYGISKLIIRKSYSPDYKVASADRTSFITNNKYDHEYDKTSDSEYLIADLNTDYGGMTWYDRGARSFNSFKIHKISVLNNLEITPSTTTQTFNYLGGAYSDTPNYDAVQNVVVKPVDKIPLRYIECDGNTFFKLISTNDTLNLLNSYTCDIQCSFTEVVSITSKSTLLNFLNITGSSHESEVIVRFGRHSSGSNMLQTHVHGEDKNILINNNYSQYTLGDETCIDVQIHNSVDSSTASKKVIISDISGASGSNINTTLPNELIAFGGYTSAGKPVCTSSSGYRIHRIILHRDQIATLPDKTRTYYEFIPVLHDGKPCFFETSTKTYRYNLGTGTPKYEIL